MRETALWNESIENFVDKEFERLEKERGVPVERGAMYEMMKMLDSKYLIKYIPIPAIVMQMCENLGYELYLNDPCMDEIFSCDKCNNDPEILYVKSSCDYFGECDEEGFCPQCLLTDYIQDSAAQNRMYAQEVYQESEKTVGIDNEQDICDQLFAEILSPGLLSDDLKVACEIYRAELNKKPVWFSWLTGKLKKQMSMEKVSNALDTLADWGIIQGAYGPTEKGCVGYIYEITSWNRSRIRDLLFYVY